MPLGAFAARARRIILVNVCGAHPLLPFRVRLRLWRWAGLQVGDSQILSGVQVLGPQVAIGDRCFVNRGCLFEAGKDADGAITLEDGVDLGYEVALITSIHAPSNPKKRAGRVSHRPVVLSEGCWLGTRVTVLPGVTVARGCVVAAGAVVTRDTEPDGLYAGVPARRVRDLPS